MWLYIALYIGSYTSPQPSSLPLVNIKVSSPQPSFQPKLPSLSSPPPSIAFPHPILTTYHHQYHQCTTKIPRHLLARLAMLNPAAGKLSCSSGWATKKKKRRDKRPAFTLPKLSSRPQKPGSELTLLLSILSWVFLIGIQCKCYERFICFRRAPTCSFARRLSIALYGRLPMI